MHALEIIEKITTGGGSIWAEADKVRARLPETMRILVPEIHAQKDELLIELQSRPIAGATPERIETSEPDGWPWETDFVRWRLERCASRRDHEDGSNIGALLLSFAEWCCRNNSAPAPREVFERLLTMSGFQTSDGMAIGLILRDDLEAQHGFTGRVN